MLELTRILARASLALFRDRSGATAIEYGLLAAGISVVIVGTVFLLGPQLNTAFNAVLTAIQGAPPAGGGG